MQPEDCPLYTHVFPEHPVDFVCSAVIFFGVLLSYVPVVRVADAHARMAHALSLQR